MQDIVEGKKMSERTMKIDLAIQRELAYRRKVAKLTGQDLGHLLPLQAKIQAQSPDSSQSLDTRTKPAKDSSLGLPQPPKQDGEIKMVSNHEDELFCKICQVPCASPFNYEQHLSGHKHKAREVANKRIWCTLCNIWCIEECAYSQHLVGKKHLKVEFTKKNGGQPQIGRTPKYCELCEIWCPDDTSFNMHLTGRSHVLKHHSTGSRKRARK